METANGKACPINGKACTGGGCAWWCSWAKDCAVPLIAGILADSEICRTAFCQEDNHEK